MAHVIDQLWVAAFSIWLAVIVITGGTGLPSDTVFVLQSAFSAAFLLVGIARLWRGFPSGAAAFGGVLAILVVALVLAQLVPLPVAFWQNLHGREIFARGLHIAGDMPTSLPLSLSPVSTRQSALALLPPLAAFVGVLSVPQRLLWQIVSAVLFAALVGMVVALLQKRGGVESGLFFYLDDRRTALPSGTFANKNFFAAQLYAAIPFVAALAMSIAQKANLRPFLTILFTFVGIGLIVAVLAVTGSRAGTILAMASLILTVLSVLRFTQKGHSASRLSGGVLAASIGLVVMAQVSMVGILRLAQGDASTDFRETISKVSMLAVKDQLPWGSGFGTFVPIYQVYETPDTIIDAYVNQAHNEWLQAVIEGGYPAMALLALFIFWVAYLLVKAFRLFPADPVHATIRASGLVVVLLAVHAIVDFPLRNAALLSLFGLSLGMLSLATAMPARLAKSKTQPIKVQPNLPESNVQRAFIPANRPFEAHKTEMESTAGIPKNQNETSGS